MTDAKMVPSMFLSQSTSNALGVPYGFRIGRTPRLARLKCTDDLQGCGHHILCSGSVPPGAVRRGLLTQSALISMLLQPCTSAAACEHDCPCPAIQEQTMLVMTLSVKVACVSYNLDTACEDLTSDLSSHSPASCRMRIVPTRSQFSKLSASKNPLKFCDGLPSMSCMVIMYS